MSLPAVYHDVPTSKKEVTSKSPKPLLSNLRDSPPSASVSASASASTSVPKKDSPRRPPSKTGGINYLDALRALPEVRPIPWMPGKELPPDKSTESPRTQTKSAFLLSTRGKINDPPCNHCTSGVGRFLHCITMDGWFHGACATCQMGTRGNLCSLRSDGGEKNKQQLTDPLSKGPSSLNSQATMVMITQASETKKPIVKRKRESLKDDPQPTISAEVGIAPAPSPSYNSPYANVPGAPSEHQQLPSYPQYHGHSLGPNYNYQDPAMMSYIYKKPNAPNGPTQPPNQLPQSSKGDSLAWIRPAPLAPTASEFHHHRPPPITEAYPPHSMNFPVKGPDRDESNSLSPSEQLLGSIQPPPAQHMLSQHQRLQNPYMQNPKYQHPPAHAGEQVNGSGTQSKSLPSIVDSFPRKKQKQIHELVRNLQDGIRGAQNQADNMQKQLDQLRAALGMDGQYDVAE